jgi:uncharacterized membrane protein YdjX (TVP38/TMEM64 family)
LIMAAFIIVGVAILIPIALQTVPVLLDLFKSGGKESAEKYVSSFGIQGIIIIIVLQIVQVLSIVIPAPTVWIIAGVTYGVFGGMLICIVGVVIGNSIAFFIGRRFGNRLIDIVLDEKKRSKLKFLENPSHSDIIQFLLYVIPGVPNSIIPYIYARTNISSRRFISIIAVASVPSILSCTYVGHNILTGNTEGTVAVVLIFLIMFAIVFKNNKKIMTWVEEFSISKR